uniref:ZZ-type domain-containing protein n=1 Tax=Globodera rostochiensis TaxID=31243 RepID=A0A914HFZ0_GLORO
MDEDDGIGGGSEAFKWEQAYTEGLNIRSVLQEDEHGSVEESIRRMVMDEKRQRRMDRRPAKIRLGIMRYVHLAVDCSSAILSSDFFPSRLAVALECLRNFSATNAPSESAHSPALSNRWSKLCRTLMPQIVAVNSLSNRYSNAPFTLFSKECILLVASLSALRHTFEQLKMRSVRCSIVSFGAEVFAFKRLCTTTAGKYSVALDEQHLALLLDEQVQPPPVKRRPGQQDTIVRMGFPQLRRVTDPSFCACHELNGEAAPPSAMDGAADEPSKSTLPRAFFCPQCGSRYCQTPVECRICGLLLLTAPQLARAHQHLESLPAFVETTIPDDENDKCCFACDEALVHKAYICPNCSTDFCIDCDLLLHESLQVCPACN